MGSAGVKAEADANRGVGYLNGLYRRFAAEHPDNVSLIDFDSYICPEGKFTDLVVDGVRMREDGTHFTPESSYIAARWLVPRVLEVATGDRPFGPPASVADNQPSER